MASWSSSSWAKSWAISRRLGRQTRGMGAAPLARVLEYHSAVLHAVREGLLLLDGDRRVGLVNDEARRLLDLGEDDVTGRHVAELGLSRELTATLSAQQVATDEVHVSGSRVLVVNQGPARPQGRSVGAVVTLRDHTDLQALTGELDSVRAAIKLAGAAPVSDFAEFEDKLRADPDDHAARFSLAEGLAASGRLDEAVDALLQIFARDREWNGGAARAKLVEIFEAAGPTSDVAKSGRKRLSSLMFS